MGMVTRRVAAAGLAVAAVVGVQTLVAPSAEAAGTYQGCPYGAVCVYPQNAGWNGGHPSLFFYSYGAHNLSNQYGNHYVFNNQYGGASSTLNKGYNGASPYFRINAYNVCNCDLTPTNSITLLPPGQ
jgi:hypothetical protein